MPVWHASVSLWTPAGQWLSAPGRAQRAAVALLDGVGGEREWWIWNVKLGIGHLRVALTPVEAAALPVMPAVNDAGPSGPERPRTPGRSRR